MADNGASTSNINDITEVTSIEQDVDVESILPQNNMYRYKILRVEKEERHNGVRLQFALNVKTKDEAKIWIKCFQEHTKTTYTVQTVNFMDSSKFISNIPVPVPTKQDI